MPRTSRQIDLEIAELESRIQRLFAWFIALFLLAVLVAQAA